jgi:eukaryotic-like serine/threonine-protein kinase
MSRATALALLLALVLGRVCAIVPGMQAGARLGHYEILFLIGKGGMGEVWKAHDAKLRRDVALKTLPPELALNPDRLARLEREATSLAAVSHPNVAAIYGLEEHEGTRFLVLELVDGVTLADRLAGGRPLSVKQALEIAQQIAEALEAAHERGVVHRDLKPANIKLTSDGRVKVLDFGLAKSSNESGRETATSLPLMTEIGTVMGTAPYMSPEQARGEAAGPQTDIWAFGVMLYEMLTGVSPFERPTTAETVARVLEAQPDLALLPRDTSASARRLVQRCLQKDRKHRVKHAGDARLEIEDALAELAAGPASQPPRAGISRRAALTGGAALGLLGVGVGASALMARRSPQPLPTPSYQRLTFRRGLIRTARFGPDFQTVLYGALWDGDACRVYSVRAESPESAALSFPAAMPLAVSGSGELALALGPHFRGVMTYGTLARVPLAGGAPRELQENVKYADWSPDGSDLVIVRRVGDRDQLELLGGELLAEPDAPGGGFSFPRFSPSGDAVAVFELAQADFLVGRVVIIERSGAKRAVSPRTYFNVHGLVWRGDEVWFTAADESPLFRNAVHAMDLTGAVRIVARVPGNTTLHDAAPDGRMLIARTDDRGGIAVRAPNEAAERDLSWLDSAYLGDISPDGRRVLFSETGVGGGPRLSTYLRGTDGAPAVRLGDGFALALSPDGRRAIVRMDRDAPHLDVIPTGPGQASRLERPELSLVRARWLPDGRHAVVWAIPENGPPQLYRLDVDGSTTQAVTPAGVTVGYAGWSASPDGSMVAVSTGQGVELFPIAGGESRRVPGSDRSSVVGWTESGLLISENPGAGGIVLSLDPATGKRTVWADIQPRDPAGIMSLDLSTFVVTPDGRGYGYSWHRATSDLYLVEGWS